MVIAFTNDMFYISFAAERENKGIKASSGGVNVQILTIWTLKVKKNVSVYFKPFYSNCRTKFIR